VSKPVETLLTEDEEHALWSVLHKTRSTSKTCTVPKEALEHLLMDHGKIVAELPEGIKTPEGKHV